jgi:flagellar biogenesis protein FliO
MTDERPGIAARGDPSRWWTGVAVVFAAGAIVTTVLASGVLFQGDDRSPGSLAAVLLAGAVTFILAVGGLVALFHALQLTNRRYPLGLPDGTVQALMALILVLLFFIMAVFLYLDVSQTTTDRQLIGLTQAAFESLSQDTQVVSVVEREAVVGVNEDGSIQKETRFDVLLASPRTTSEVAQDIARQLITSLGTLIAAIAAFYFGAKSVGGGSLGGPRDAEEQERPTS